MTPAAAEWLGQLQSRVRLTESELATATGLARLADENGELALEVDERGEITDRQAARIMALAGPNRAERRAMRRRKRGVR
ncbi:hypothetical protein [Jiangella mangrovi]|uniref:Uncharacterized protein n=1 Tax=Jiangella mangrovi TaxID=1524084 RepID=A0A7W9LPU9_9ACTN|nr:hypothetical protein [Jiangella mangrovi]MBB5791785.1 hypothetical protein [Jiangella mangrovi]